MLLIDSSGSMGETLFDDVIKPFAKRLVREIESRFDINAGSTRMGVLTFSAGATFHLHLEDGTSVQSILDAIDDVDFFGAGAGSMNVVQLVEEVKERAGVAMANEDVFLNTTFGAFINAVVKIMR